MKVICINATNYITGGKNRYIVEGGIYEPHGDAISPSGEDCYLITTGGTTITRSGILTSEPMYKKSRFIPLSEIDERELLYNRQTELV